MKLVYAFLRWFFGISSGVSFSPAIIAYEFMEIVESAGWNDEELFRLALIENLFLEGAPSNF